MSTAVTTFMSIEEPTSEPSSPLSIVCGNATAEDKVALISCPVSNQSISYVAFASYGTPAGSCGQYTIGDCNSATSMSVVSGLCIGKNSCSVPASNSISIFGDPCVGTYKHLYIQVVCGGESRVTNTTIRNASSLLIDFNLRIELFVALYS